MKVFLLFLLSVFFLGLATPGEKPARMLPLLGACVVVAYLMTSYRFA